MCVPLLPGCLEEDVPESQIQVVQFNVRFVAVVGLDGNEPITSEVSAEKKVASEFGLTVDGQLD